MTVMPELHALVTAHERLIQALLREIGRADPAMAGRLAASLREVAGTAAGDDGESAPDLVRVLEDYMILLRNPDVDLPKA